MGHKLVCDGVELGGLFTLTGDDQGRAGLVDEDGVHLVHDGEGVSALHQLVGVDGHVVTQIVEAELVVGAVGDVGVVSGLLLAAGHTVDDQTHAQAQETVDLAHPLAVSLGQVVVDGDHVDTLTGQGVQVGGQSGDQGFAFAGAHLGNAALVQDNTAHQLYAVVAHTKHAPGSFAAGGKGLGENIVQGSAVGQAGLQLGGLGLELSVGQSLVLFFQCLNFVYDGIDRLQLPLGGGAEDLGKQTHVIYTSKNGSFREPEMAYFRYNSQY